METLGPFGDEAMDLVKDVGRRLIESRAYLTQRISIAIQRGKAAIVRIISISPERAEPSFPPREGVVWRHLTQTRWEAEP